MKIIQIIKSFRNHYLRKLRWNKYDIKESFHAGRGVVLMCRNNISIGRNCYLGRYSQIECDAELGDNVMFGNYVALVGRYDHNFTEIGVPTRLASRIMDKAYDWKGIDSKVIIEDDVWIGYGSIILSGVKIGRGSIVAAGSVVSRNVEPYTIVGGNPATFLKYRFTPDEILEHERILYNK